MKKLLIAAILFLSAPAMAQGTDATTLSRDFAMCSAIAQASSNHALLFADNDGAIAMSKVADVYKWAAIHTAKSLTATPDLTISKLIKDAVPQYSAKLRTATDSATAQFPSQTQRCSEIEPLAGQAIQAMQAGQPTQ